MDSARQENPELAVTYTASTWPLLRSLDSKPVRPGSCRNCVRDCNGFWRPASSLGSSSLRRRVDMTHTRNQRGARSAARKGSPAKRSGVPTRRDAHDAHRTQTALAAPLFKLKKTSQRPLPQKVSRTNVVAHAGGNSRAGWREYR